MTERLPRGQWSGPYLRVDGAPFLVLGAEIHNSSSSTVVGITTSFTHVKELGANTVLAPVAWDQLEPAETKFDPTLIDAMIDTAAAVGLKLVPLWFGSWKNGMSTYVPGWVKTDAARFPRAQLPDGRLLEHLSPFGTASRDADARAFSFLTQRIAAVDEQGVVIAVQVENEVGLLGAARDYSPLAQEALLDRVPPVVVDAVACNGGVPLHAAWISAGAPAAGSWTDVFGDDETRDEAFMATAYASYVDYVARSRDVRLDVPLFVNAWLDADSILEAPVAMAGGKRPGDYPSGGPVLRVAPVWEAVAPTLDFLAPDVYVDDAEPVFAGYASRRGRLFVPEIRADLTGVAQMFAAVGEHRALGVSPFGVDALDPTTTQGRRLMDAQGLLAAVGWMIAEDPDVAMHGFVLHDVGDRRTITVGSMSYTVAAVPTPAGEPVQPSYGIAVEDGDGLVVVGRGLRISFTARGGGEAGILSAEHIAVDSRGQHLVSRLNGDETGGGTGIVLPHIDRAVAEDQPIPPLPPDIAIVRVRGYAF